MEGTDIGDGGLDGPLDVITESSAGGIHLRVAHPKLFAGRAFETLAQLAQGLIAPATYRGNDVSHHGTDVGFVAEGGPGQDLGLPGAGRGSSRSGFA